jgi:hypothetical protein
MKYIVSKREVWVRMVEVEAGSPQEAIDKVKGGEGATFEDNFEYSHTLPDHLWTCEEGDTDD